MKKVVVAFNDEKGQVLSRVENITFDVGSNSWVIVGPSEGLIVSKDAMKHLWYEEIEENNVV